MYKIAETPPPQNPPGTDPKPGVKISTILHAGSVAFFGYRAFTAKGTCKVIAGTMATISIIELLLRAKQKQL